jgi:hypothetical protein
MTRLLFAIAAASLIAVQVVRNAIVSAFSESAPAVAAKAWAGHPSSEIATALTEVGESARAGRPVPSWVFARLDDAALKAPLAPTPFLVRGVQAQLAGDNRLALAAYLAAERRDPRSLPAHYFLAERFFRASDARRGLVEVAALARLAPAGADNAAPYIAAYAKDRSTWPQLKGIFRDNPTLAAASLATLSRDAGNSDAILALADAQQLSPGSAWVQPLLTGLIAGGRYDRALSIWGKVSKRSPTANAIYDGGFADAEAPPPFNWELMSSAVGLAERQPGGRLHVIFHGRQDGLLARQLLLLSPGRYRLSMSVAADMERGKALNWSLRCSNAQAPFSGISLDALRKQAWTLTVPSDCGAQWLELSGVSGDVAQPSDFTMSGLKLTTERSGG